MLFVQILMILNNQVSEEELNVKLAILKLLEVISIKNPELFYLNFWTLGFDNVGIEYKDMAAKKMHDVHKFPSPFYFVSFFSKLVKKQIEVKYHTILSEMTPDFNSTMAREWIVVENKIDSEDDLSEIAMRFLNYMTKIQGKVLTPIVNVDEIIIEDFKRLNDFSVK